MKRLLQLSVLLFLCTWSWAAPITKEQARKKALEFLEKRPNISLARGIRQAYAAPDVNGTQQVQVGFYAFNIGQQDGFVLISGDDRTPAILGYADQGTFDTNKMPEAMKWLLDSYERQISLLDHVKAYKAPANKSDYTAISPLIKTQWDQAEPYNDLCPIDPTTSERCITGCEATAMAQIINYHQYPEATIARIPAYTSNTRSISVAAIEPTAIDWNHMCNNYFSSYTTEEATAVATLMQLCGAALKMDYTSDGSGAYDRDAALSLKKYFGYSEDIRLLDRKYFSADGWDETIYNELANDRPVLFGAQSTGGGHAFVIDGYDSNRLFHVNWGWSGYCDGYFLLSVLDPSSNSGAGASSSTDGYSFNQAAIIGIEPAPTVAPNVLNSTTFKVNSTNTVTELTRNSDGTFECKLSINFYNDYVTAYNYSFGAYLFDAEDNWIEGKIFEDSYTIAQLSRINGTRDFSFGKGLDSGTYFLRGVSKRTSDEDYHINNGSEVQQIIVEIDGDKATLTNSFASLKCTLACMTANPKVGQPVDFKASITNAGTYYSNNLDLVINNDKKASRYFEVAKDGTADFEISYIPTEEGEIEAKIQHYYNNKNITIATTTATIAGLSSASLGTTISIDGLNPDGTLNKKSVTAHLTITNNGTDNYNDDVNILLVKVDKDGKMTPDQFEHHDLSLAVGSSTDLTARFDNLENATDYGILLRYFSNGKYTHVRSQGIFFTTDTEGYTNTGNLDDNTYYIYNKGTKKYLAAGSDWGTHTIVNNTGLDYFIECIEGNQYTIDSNVSNGGENHYLNGVWNDGEMYEWIITKNDDDTYSISNGSQYLTAGTDGIVILANNADADNAKWTFKTYEERLEELENATSNHGVDATFLIKAADFGRNDLRVSEWTRSNNCINWNLSGGLDVNRCAESWHSTFTISQDIPDAPSGTYALTAQGFYRNDGSDNVNLPYFFINNSQKIFPLRTGSENTMDMASESFSKGLYTIEPIWAEAGLDGLTLGTSCNNTQVWAIWDNFRLMYYGQSDDSQLTMLTARYSELAAEAEELLNNENINSYATGLLEDALSMAHETADELEAAIESLETNIQEVKALIQSIKKYYDFREKAEDIISQDDVYTGDVALTAYITNRDNYDMLIEDASEIDSYITGLRQSLSQFLSNVTIHKGKAFDLTSLIYNPMMQSTEGWLGTTPRILWEGESFLNGEFYEVDFDVYQELSDMPAGNYTLKVQAFERPGSNADTYSNYLNGIDHSRSYIYINDGATKVKNVMSESSATQLFTGGTSMADYQRPDGRWTPNGMEGAHIFFEAGYYENEVLTAVEKGNLRFGFRCIDHASYSWTLFSNFRLYYSGGAIDVTLDENTDLQLISDIDNANITLQRTVKANEWQGMSLPFSLTADEVTSAFGDNAQVVLFASDFEDDLIFTPSTTGVEAHHPFLLKTSEAGTTYQFEGKRIVLPTEMTKTYGNGTYYNFTYNYLADTPAPTHGYHIVDNRMVRYEEGATLKVYDAYIEKKGDITYNELNYSTDGQDPKRIDDNEWTVLKQCYAATDGAHWTTQWPVASEHVTTRELNGVTAHEGKVTSIELNDNNLTGNFPYMLLTLPQLKRINLKNNNLSGDIGIGMYAFTSQYPTTPLSPIETLWLNSNHLEGNIGLFASFLTTLKELDATDNRLSDVAPMISPTVTSLNLGTQNIQTVYDLDLAAPDPTALPSILFYNHEAQTYNPSFNLMVSTEHVNFPTSDTWTCKITCNEEGTKKYSLISENYIYNKAKGYAIYVSDNINGIRFQARLTFPDGDSNFNGEVDITDVQTDINYIFENQAGYPFNYTAANLWNDEQINVQDIVKLVDILLAQEPDPEPAGSRMTAVEETVTAAVVSCEDGYLMLNTTRPVAAFDIVIAEANMLNTAQALTQMGFTCAKSQLASGGIHLIGYSLSGATLPVGQTMLGYTSQPKAYVSKARLADTEAQAIATSLNQQTTAIGTVTQGNSRQTVYRLPIGAHRSIMIDNHGRKTMEKAETGRDIIHNKLRCNSVQISQ